MSGFGKDCGPSIPPKNTFFGAQSQSPSPLPPTHAHSHPQRLATFTRSQYDNRPSEAVKKSRSPPLGFRDNHSYGHPQEAHRPAASPQKPIFPINYANMQAQERPLPSYLNVDYPESKFRSPPANFQVAKRTRSPLLSFRGEVPLSNIHHARGDFERRAASPQIPQHPMSNANLQALGRPLRSYVDLDDLGGEFQAEPPDFLVGKRARSPPLQTPDKVPFGSPRHIQDDSERLLTRPGNFQPSKRSRSPPSPFSDKAPKGNSNYDERQEPRKDFFFYDPIPKASPGIQSPPMDSENTHFNNGTRLHGDAQSVISLSRSAGSSPIWEYQPTSQVIYANSQNHKMSLLGARGDDDNMADVGNRISIKSANFQIPKRIKSPLPSSADNHLRKSPSINDDNERETQAKAKRLARFNVELSEPLQSLHGQKVSAKKHNQSPERKKVAPAEEVDLSNIGTTFDFDGVESSSAVVGLCQDMCPESEREERERKGDLDKYERLDGDRNQTNRYLAVKKYNRTAEREAELIRPMPVLQNTINYLLGLLDQPYDDKFLGIYNFLWDRMRAIRMDLRMQHIFNCDSVIMLEQMIRLHIIAIHQLCEYTKGEGFSEGFDAHLNIEQMNKASVELFQLYNDHRKKGIAVPSEKEFRGYYALLKLDKHPGYKVEPGELSLDLAKMPPEIRGTPEVLFARAVARACRTGNFITFFRLARKATYLQACLMHAHFAKLRTQALASLHSGLQNNQGIPIAHVVYWLGMEGEDIESLLEYHGFSIRKFECVYMVKDGPFLNTHVDFETKCSELVHLKKSSRIVDDVSSSKELSVSSDIGKVIADDKVESIDVESPSFVETKGWTDVADEDMPDYEDDSASRNLQHNHPMLEVPLSDVQEFKTDFQMNELISSPPDNSYGHPQLAVEVGESSSTGLASFLPDRTLSSLSKKWAHSPSGRFSQNESFNELPSPHIVESSIPQDVVIQQEEEALMPSQNDEVAVAKLKLILRIWRRLSLKQRELREQRRMTTSAALSSLALGLPIWQKAAQWSRPGDLNIDDVVRERFYMHKKSWSRLNVSEVVASILREKNPNSKCICWKLISCSQMNGMEKSMQKIHTSYSAGTWLFSKLMNAGNEDDHELVVSSSGLSIWSKWVKDPQICCLSVIRDIIFDNTKPVVEEDLFSGANALLFLASENVTWEFQRTQLQNFLSSVPLGYSLPLLILIDGAYREESPSPYLSIARKLGLYDIDRKQVSTFSVIYLGENWSPDNVNGFFSDDKLREGLMWLANQSHPQPVVQEVRTRELVSSYLISSLESLDSKGSSEVGPDDCILAFNEALDRSAEEILVAADMNKSALPCPEVYLLNKSSSEHRAVSLFLPAPSWRSSAKAQSTVTMIRGCRLPYFSSDLSWLKRGSEMGKELQTHKSMLEKCITGYLFQTSKMMTKELATREASIILQSSAGLELVDLTYRIVPHWVMIFRRIFNWRLINLVHGAFSAAYVLECPYTPHAETSINLRSPFTPLNDLRGSYLNRTLKQHDEAMLERYQQSPQPMAEATLDEMAEVACQLQFEKPELVSVAFQPHSITVENESHETAHMSPRDCEELGHALIEDHSDGPLLHESNGIIQKATEVKEADKLSLLLEQCNLVQDLIDEKLAIYY